MEKTGGKTKKSAESKKAETAAREVRNQGWEAVRTAHDTKGLKGDMLPPDPEQI